MQLDTATCNITGFLAYIDDPSDEAGRDRQCWEFVTHNHPSGIAEPSQADEIITTRLRDALALVEIRLLDHLIIGDGQCTSLAEKGLI